VITAWQYPFRSVVGFIVFTTAVELLALIPEVEAIDTDTLLLLGVPAVRAFAFGTVGHIVSRLTATQREQREALMTANVQLAQHAQTLAQLAASRERNRLARELHDTLAHTLSGLAVNLEALKTVMPSDAGEANRMLDDSLAITRTGLGETRRALRALRAQPLEDLGLSLALRNLATSLAARAELALDLELTHDLSGLPPETEQNLYRIVQEGLENIARHADARYVALRLLRGDEGLVLTLEDDGRGFAPADASAELSYGLRGMRERAEEIGAQLTVASTPGTGTLVTVILKEAI
jgi:signal transduction histidine kinase